MTIEAGGNDNWRIWQLIDSAFPAGGFSHSGGLEAAWQAGWVRTSEDLDAFLLEATRQATHAFLPFVGAAWRGDDLGELDQLLDTYLSNHVANRASRQQGMTFLTAAEVFGLPEVADLRRKTLAEGNPGHYPVVFGAVVRALGFDQKAALRTYLFIAIRGTLSAGVRLGVVGPFEAQRLQMKLDPHLDEAVSRAACLSLEDVCQTSPLMELLQMGQDRLYSRLFQS